MAVPVEKFVGRIVIPNDYGTKMIKRRKGSEVVEVAVTWRLLYIIYRVLKE